MIRRRTRIVYILVVLIPIELHDVVVGSVGRPFRRSV